MRSGWLWLCAAAACGETTTPTERPVPTGGLPTDTATPPPPTDTAPTTDTTTAPTCPPDTCAAADLDCIAVYDNAPFTKFGLRMSQLVLTKPAGLATGLFASVFADKVVPNDPDCSLLGDGQFSWLIELDTAGHTAKIGGAKPAADPVAGYSFVNAGGIAPVIVPNVAVDGTGAFTAADAPKVSIPAYLDPAGVQSIVLPLTGLDLTGTLSVDKNCIGAYNAAGLLPANYCWGDETTPSFLDGGTVDALIALEDADTVIIGAFAQSLCVWLSGDPTAWGTYDEIDGITRCARDTYGVILFQGDACTDPEGSCTDALEFSGTYAASAVKILP